MKRMRYLPILAMIGLAACVPATPEGETTEISEEVRGLAAPGQDLTSVRIESDGCYWFLHRGPVETTFLPVLTREGRMICTRPQA